MGHESCSGVRGLERGLGSRTEARVHETETEGCKDLENPEGSTEVRELLEAEVV